MKAFKLTALAGAAAIAFTAAPAAADVINYDVSNATSNSCPHGLWTNNAFHSGCSKKFSFQDGTTFSVDTDAGTGTFSGTAINNLGETAVIDFTLTGLLDDLSGSGFNYKRGGGDPYDPSVQDFFTGGSGTITIGGDVFTLNPSDPFAGSTVFQWGAGANALNSSPLGGSAWINILDPLGNALRHWDINFNLTERPTEVPAPGGLALFGLGLMGLWFGQKRRRKLATA